MPAYFLPSTWTRLCCLLVVLASASPLHGWDATGHRLSVYVAYQSLTSTQRDYWREVLQHHPRFEADFKGAMPANIQQASRGEQTRWLLGQAAVWPDLARGLHDDIRRRYNKPDWHWIDGAWVRDEAQTQGNLYLATPPLPDIQGAPATNRQHASHASNVLTALERAHWQLEHETDPAQRAIALCWLLHLIGDIHQPLHTGALVSGQLFPDGDRGGNRIRTRDGNLHADWDRALRGAPFDDRMRELLAITASLPDNAEYKPTRWLQESRSILLRQVYPPSVINTVRRSETTGESLGSISLSNRYQDTMQRTASIRIAEAGVRVAKTLSTIAGAP